MQSSACVSPPTDTESPQRTSVLGGQPVCLFQTAAREPSLPAEAAGATSESSCGQRHVCHLISVRASL